MPPYLTFTTAKVKIKLPSYFFSNSHGWHFGVFIINFKHISQLVLVFLLSTLDMQLPAGKFPEHSLPSEQEWKPVLKITPTLPTRKYCPPRSNKFIATIASLADCCVAYSIKPYPLCFPVIWSGASLQDCTWPNASNTLQMKRMFSL